MLGSSRLAHVIVQAEIETFALEADGEVAWRVAHSDVVTEVELVGGRLVLTSFDGQVRALDPRTGRAGCAPDRPGSRRIDRWTTVDNRSGASGGRWISPLTRVLRDR